MLRVGRMLCMLCMPRCLSLLSSPLGELFPPFLQVCSAGARHSACCLSCYISCSMRLLTRTLPACRFAARVQGAAQPFYATAEEGEEFTLDTTHFCRAIATGEFTSRTVAVLFVVHS